jgi:long-chain acyl-CoA synthetase
MYPGHWANIDPHRPAVIMGATGEAVTYAQLDEGSNRLARLFADAGLARGDHIALLMENHPRYFEVVWAALRSGLYLTPVNRHLAADEVRYVLEDSEARVLITSHALADVVNQIDWAALKVERLLMVDGQEPGFDDYEKAVAAFASEALDNETSGSVMLYTSGTTGRPKGVLRPLPETAPSDAPPGGISAMVGFGEATVYLSPAPLYHAAPLGFTTAVHRAGGTAVVMERFDPASALDLIQTHRVTHSQWVPTMFVRMLGLPRDERLAFDLSSHTVAVHAAAPCPVDVKRQMIDWWGPILLEYYGSTEGVGMTIISSADWLDHPGSVGRDARGTVHIVGEDGNEVARGEVGLVYFAGGASFVYKDAAEKTESLRLPGGLSTVGDAGYLDEDGWLYLTDRKDFMIIAGGVNIYPREIEDVMIMHPSVLDVAVFGVPDDDLGEQVKAAVQLVVDQEPSPALTQDLMAYCRERLAAFKCPRSIDFVDELPRTPTGKLRKHLLRDPYWEKTRAP